MVSFAPYTMSACFKFETYSTVLQHASEIILHNLLSFDLVAIVYGLCGYFEFFESDPIESVSIV